MKLVSYTVKPGQAEANVARIEAVFAELAESGLQARYSVYRDGDRFFHLADGDGFSSLPAFRAFLEGHESRRVGATETTGLAVVGSY